MYNTFESIMMDVSKRTDLYVDELYVNPNLTWNLVERLPGLEWDFYRLSEHPCITWDIVQTHPDKEWSWSDLSKNPSLYSYIRKHPDKEWNWFYLSKNPNLTWDFVLEHPYEDWDWSALTTHSNISFDTILAHSHHEWDWSVLGSNPSVTPEIVKANPEVGWDFRYLSRNLNITYEFVSEYRQESWDERYLSLQLKLPPSFRIDDPWFWRGFLLSRNPSISWDTISALPNEFDWYHLSRQPHLADRIRTENAPWDDEGIAANPALLGYVENVRGRSKNPAITYSFFCEYDDWDFPELCRNVFVHDPYVAASRIYKAYKSRDLKYRLPLVALRSVTNDMIRYRPGTGVEYYRVLNFFENKEWMN